MGRPKKQRRNRPHTLIVELSDAERRELELIRTCMQSTFSSAIRDLIRARAHELRTDTRRPVHQSV